MINFIICDDDIKFTEFVNQVITKYMMKNKLEYKVHKFYDYNKEFIKKVEEKIPNKIYILDIEAPSKSGIDVARIIRNKDVNSVIIFLTGHQELGQTVMKNDFLFLSFINKFDDCENRLVKAIERAFKVLDTKRSIRFKDNGTIYTIALDDILYITKDSVARKSIIKTDYAEFMVGKTLSEIGKMLDGYFVKTHRSCLVNTKRVASYSKPKRLILLDNGELLDIVSSRFEGELI